MHLWTYEHAVTLLPAVAVMIGIGVLLRFAIGNKAHHIRMIPLQVLSAILVLLEIGKQLLSILRGYDLYHLPFHFCSLFIFVLPAMSLYRGKHRQTVYAVTASLCAAVFALLMIYPNLIYSATDVNQFFTDYFSFHTVAFHNIVVFAFVLIVALRLHTPAPKGESKAVVWFTVGFCVVSALMAQLLKTNFNNFYSCNIAPLELLRTSLQSVLGYGVTQALYVAIVTALNIGFVLGAYWLYRPLRRLCAGEKTVKERQRGLCAKKSIAA